MAPKYHLRLADDSQWLLSSDDNIASWLNEFARVMCLKKGHCVNVATNTIHFHSLLSDEAPQKIAIKKNLYSKKWMNLYNGMPIQLWMDKQAKENIVELNTDFFNVRDMYYLYMSTSLTPFFFHSLNAGGIPIHAALTCFKDQGVLITATGDTGKTTCCKRLPKGDWHYLCDDLSLLIRTPNNELYAHLLPTWSDYMIRRTNTRWQVEKKVPVKALFFLEQGGKDEIIPLSNIETTIRFQSAVKQAWFLDMEDSPEQKRSRNKLIFENTQQIAKEIPAYVLRATLTGEFWKLIEKVL